MMNDIALGGGIGVLLALALSVPAIVLELRRRHKGHPLLIDIHVFGGKRLNDRESFALGLLFHLLLGLGFGVLYPLNPSVWTFAGSMYGLQSLATYGLGLFLFANVIVFPLMGLGAFGAREDRWIGTETAVSMVLLVLGYFWIVQWFQPAWF